METAQDSLYLERECNALGELYNNITADLKNNCLIWEDFALKANKFHCALKFVLQTTSSFLDAFQKVADIASKAQGGTREMGAALTRIVLRQKTLELKLKTFTGHIADSVANPILEKLEEWRKNTFQLDKDRLKETKQVKAEIKRSAGESIRLTKKAQKKTVIISSGSRGAAAPPRNALQQQLSLAMADTNSKYNTLMEVELLSVRRAMVEERQRFCYLISCLKPLMDSEFAIFEDIAPLSDQMNELCLLASVAPNELPLESEQILTDLRSRCSGVPLSTTTGRSVAADTSSSLGSRKSSMASISSIASSSGSSNCTALSALVNSNGNSIGFVQSQSTGSDSQSENLSLQDSVFTNSQPHESLYLQGLAAFKAFDSQSQSVSAAAAAGVKSFEKKNIVKAAIPQASSVTAALEDEMSCSGESDEETEEDDDARTRNNSDGGGVDSESCDPAQCRSKFEAAAAASFSKQQQPAGLMISASSTFANFSNNTNNCHSFQPSQELYPGCALPPPVYSNLTELANAAKRKFSVQHQDVSSLLAQVVQPANSTVPPVSVPQSLPLTSSSRKPVVSSASNMLDLGRAVGQLQQQVTDEMMAGEKSVACLRANITARNMSQVEQSMGIAHKAAMQATNSSSADQMNHSAATTANQHHQQAQLGTKPTLHSKPSAIPTSNLYKNVPPQGSLKQQQLRFRSSSQSGSNKQQAQQQQQQQQQTETVSQKSENQMLSELHRHLNRRRSEVETAQANAERIQCTSELADTSDPLLRALRSIPRLRSSRHRMRDRSAPNLREFSSGSTHLSAALTPPPPPPPAPTSTSSFYRYK